MICFVWADFGRLLIQHDNCLPLVWQQDTSTDQYASFMGGTVEGSGIADVFVAVLAHVVFLML